MHTYVAVLSHKSVNDYRCEVTSSQLKVSITAYEITGDQSHDSFSEDLLCSDRMEMAGATNLIMGYF